MDELSIRIRIANREFPMRVAPEEETRVRKAAKMVNEQMHAYSEQFGIQDPQDLLAMVAFDSLVSQMKTTENLESTEKNHAFSLKEIDSILTNVLKQDDL